MENIFDLEIKGDLRNLYLIDDDFSNCRRDFLEFLENRDIDIINNSNLIYEEYDSFTIDKSRNIQRLHNEKNSNDKKIFIINAKYFTNDAEHSLLKLFEDTNNLNHFFIFSENAGGMLDTILSRAIFIKLKNSDKKEDTGKIFLNKLKKDRLIAIEELIKNHKIDSDSASLRNEAKSLINSIEKHLYENKKEILNKDEAFKLSELTKARKYLSTSGASVKMILEHIALVV